MFKNFQKNKKNVLDYIGRFSSTARHLPSTVYCLFALVLSLSVNVAIGLVWLTLAVALFDFYRFSSTVHRPPSIVLPIIFFFLHVIALIYTSNIQAGLSELLLKSSLLIFPLAMWLSPPSKKAGQRILMCFVVGCLLTGLVCFVRSLLNYQIKAVSWLSYTWLSSQMGFLPAYLSMYMGFSFFIIINWLKADWQKTGIGKRFIGFLALFFAGYMIIMLGARLVSVTFIMLLIGLFLIWMYRRNMFFRGLFATVLFALALWKLMNTFFVTRTRMNRIIGKQLHDYDHNFFININDPRGQIWESCVAAMEQMPMWGYGIGDEIEGVLLQMYDLKNYQHLLIVDTNAHSQYVQTFLSLGYVGLFCLLVMLAVPLYLSWKKKSYLYLLFLLFISIPMLTECMLETAHGLMYFSFFNSLLCCSLTRNPSNILR